MKCGHKRFGPEWWQWMTIPEPNSGCLLWTGNAGQDGYGRVAKGLGGHVLVHRIAYQVAFGPFDHSLKVCHRCDTPSCVNPDHLYLGTQTDNMRDMFAKGRARPNGITPKRFRRPPPATVTTPELALVNSHESGANEDKIHLLRTTGMLAGWRHVTGVPAKRPTQAVVLWKPSPHADR